MHTDLSALISSRICHDLISPVGAVSNGVELLTAMGASKSPELGLITESVSAATAKLKFFRVAFGFAPEGAFVSTQDIRNDCAGLFDRRTNVAWEVSETELPRAVVRRAYLGLMCMERSLPLGGDVAVSAADAPEAKLEIVATGPKIEADRDLWNMLRSTPYQAEIAPSDVQFAALGDVLVREGILHKLTISETDIRLSFGS